MRKGLTSFNFTARIFLIVRWSYYEFLLNKTKPSVLGLTQVVVVFGFIFKQNDRNKQKNPEDLLPSQ